MPRKLPALDLAPREYDPRVLPLLRLAAQNRPDPPHTPTEHITARVPAHVARWVRATADRVGITRSDLIARALTREFDHDVVDVWPADVEDWLLKQAAAVGHPGDIDQAVIALVRYLADYYPNGAVLDAGATPVP